MTNDYSWDTHPAAVLGTIYLYLQYDRNTSKIPESEIEAFVARHQDDGRLDATRVRAAMSAVAKLDGGPGLGASKLLTSLWTALTPLIRQLSGEPSTKRTRLIKDVWEGHNVEVACGVNHAAFNVTLNERAVTEGFVKQGQGRWRLCEMDPDGTIAGQQQERLEKKINEMIDASV